MNKLVRLALRKLASEPTEAAIARSRREAQYDTDPNSYADPAWVDANTSPDTFTIHSGSEKAPGMYVGRRVPKDPLLRPLYEVIHPNSGAGNSEYVTNWWANSPYYGFFGERSLQDVRDAYSKGELIDINGRNWVPWLDSYDRNRAPKTPYAGD